MGIEWQKLIEHAREVLENSYAPYSKYNVAAALLCESGNIYTGTNVENSSYGLTICAERVAVFNAITAGEREFKAIAIVTSGKKKPSPCGACLQVLSEFANDIPICCISIEENKPYISNLSKLLPSPFKLK